MLEIELRRVMIREDFAGEEPCCLCGTPFEVRGVYAWATNGRGGSGIDDYRMAACPGCVEYFGKKDPERFPTLEEYRAAERLYPEPMIRGGLEELVRLEEREGAYEEVHAASEIPLER